MFPAAALLVLFAVLLPMGKSGVWHWIRTTTIAAVSLLLLGNAAHVFFGGGPSYSTLGTPQVAYGAWLNLLAAVVAGAGAFLRAPLDWVRR